jgi:adenylate cyclase
MDAVRSTGILRSITEAGLAGTSELDLLREFCTRLNADGLPVSRSNIVIDTLHPVHEGRVFRWRRDEDEANSIVEYGRTHEGTTAEN